MVTLRSLESWEAGYPVLPDGEQPAEDILYWKQVAQASNYPEALVLLDDVGGKAATVGS